MNHVYFSRFINLKTVPNCGGLKKEQWPQDRMSELLPTTYYHLVFTLPQELRPLVMGNRTILFNLLFDAGHHTINRLGADKKWLGAKPGIVSIVALEFRPL